jgi:ABC-type spermidine/putrescine transport system permease subunit I
MMNIKQKIALIIGAFLLLLAVFITPLHTVVVPNPDHRPYSRATSAYINVTEPDYGLIFWRVVGVAGATWVAFVLIKPKEGA